MMASLREISDVECGKNAGPWVDIRLSEFKPSDLYKNKRSQRNWALIYMKAILVVKLVVTDATGGSECCGSGCITGLHNSDNGSIKLTVRTVAHLGYDKDEESRTTLRLFIPDTDIVLESRNVELEKLHRVDDIAMLCVKFDSNSFRDFEKYDILTDIRNALMPDMYTLCKLVLRKYQCVKFPLSSFLRGEINCLKVIGFASDQHDVLELQLEVEHSYVIDVILFMFGFASHPHDLRELLGKIADGSNINVDTLCSPVTVVSKQSFTEQFGLLDKYLTSLCKPLSELKIHEVSHHFRGLFPFEISFEMTKSDVMTMLVGYTSLSEQKSEEVGMETGQVLRLLDENRKAGKEKEKEMTRLGCLKLDDREEINKQNCELQDVNPKYEIEIKEHDTELTDVGPDDERVKEEQDSRLSHVNTRRRKLEENTTLIYAGLGYEKTKETADLTLVTMKPPNIMPIEGNKYEETLAALISYPHGNEPQRITLGDLKREHDKEVFYETPSCSGSSGGLICLIPGKPGTELEYIRFATHSTGTDMGAMHVAVCGPGLALKNIGSATASAAVEDEGVGVLFTFPDKQI